MQGIKSLSDLSRSILRPVMFRIAESRTGRKISNKIKKIHKYYECGSEERSALDHKHLIRLLSYAIEKVPYYSKTIDGTLVKKIIRDPKYYMDLPILTKDIVNEAGAQMLSIDFNVSNLKKMKTGGSTGPSAFFYYDQEAADWSSATTWYCRSHHESFHHNRQLHFACDFGEAQGSPYRDLRALGEYLATNRVNIYTMNFAAAQIDYYLQQLVEMRPNIVHGHPSTMYAISKHALEKGINYYKGIFNYFESSGETLHQYQKNLIEKAFACKVINRYGLAEAGVVAYQTDVTAQALEIMSHLVFPEYFSSDGRHEFIFTTLRNFAMPLIRYNSQDIVVPGPNYPAAKGGFISSVEGRIHDFIEIGVRKIPTHAVMDVLDHRVGGIHEFQVVKSRATGGLTLRIVPVSELFDRNVANEKLAIYFGMPIDLEIVSEAEIIRTGVRNKFRHLVEVN